MWSAAAIAVSTIVAIYIAFAANGGALFIDKSVLFEAGADKEAIDREIWETFGEEWCVMATDLAGTPTSGLDVQLTIDKRTQQALAKKPR